MFAVEIYAAVRRFVFVEEKSRGGAGLRIEPGYDFQNVPLFGAARLCAIQGSGAAEARTARTRVARGSADVFRPAIEPDHICLCSRFIKEDKTFGVQTGLAQASLLAGLGDIGAVLFSGAQ
jgi:hypothetical protein